MVRKAASVRESAADEVSPLRRAHLAVDDTIQRLHTRVATLLNSPKHDPNSLNSYVNALEKLVQIARETDAAARPPAKDGGANPSPGSGGPRYVVPGLISDQEEWQRQMGLHEAKRVRE